MKDRAARNQARAEVAKKDGVSPINLKGDVGHSKARSKGGGNSLANLFIQNPSQNRSFARTSAGAMKSELSLKERAKGMKAASQRKR